MERKLTVKHDDSKCLSGTKDGLNGLEKGTKQLRNLLTVLAKLGTRAKNFTHSMPCIIAPGLKVVIRLITILESWQVLSNYKMLFGHDFSMVKTRK